MKKPDPLQAYEKACLDLVRHFCDTYFDEDMKEGFDREPYFIGDDVTGTFEISDFYLSHVTCYEYLKNKYTRDEFSCRYYEELDFLMAKEIESSGFPNIEHWKKLKESGVKMK